MPKCSRPPLQTAWCGGRNGRASQLHIYGPLEARLTQSDRVIIGGLVEGVWPPAPRIDPWLSRPMRHELGLDLPERRIGLSAHDFAQLLGTEDVILSHSAKVGGAPAVASRFLHRLEAVAGEERWKAAKAGRRAICSLRAARSTAPDEVKPIAQPAAEAAARDAAAKTLGHRDRGLAARSLHDLCTPYSRSSTRSIPSTCRCRRPIAARQSTTRSANSRRTYADALPPDDPVRVLRRHRRKYFAPLMERPEARALWWPRFQRIARWFVDWETARRGDIATHRRRDQGRDRDPLDNERTFVLSARADRIERRARRQLCHPRLQDRAAADRQAGADGIVAAAHAGGGDPARRRL